MKQYSRTIACMLLTVIAIICLLNSGNVPRTIHGETATSSHVKESTYQIDTSADDAEVFKDSVSFTSRDLELHGIENKVSKDTWLRFHHIYIPEGAKVTELVLEFTGYESSTRSMTSTIQMEQAIHSTAFESSVLSFDQRKLSEKSVTFTIPSLSRMLNYRTPNLSSLLPNDFDETRATDEVTLAYKISGVSLSGRGTMYAYDGSKSCAPRLHLKYVLPEGKEMYRLKENVDDGIESSMDGTVDLLGDVSIGSVHHNDERSRLAYTSFRFPKVNLPKDAEIERAYLEFTTNDTTSSGDFLVSIRLERTRSLPLKPEEKNIQNRLYTTKEEHFQMHTFTKANQIVQTPNLASVIDEVRLLGWKQGEPMLFTLQSQGYLGSVYSGGSGLFAPRLVIEYRQGSGPKLPEDTKIQESLHGVFINEVAPEGSRNEKEDWIELYNSNAYPIYIKSGVFLENGSKKHELKDIFIPKKGYRILLSDECVTCGTDHLSFKLSSKASNLRLTDTRTGVRKSCDEFTYGGNTVYDDTYARTSDGHEGVSQYIRGGSYASSNDRKIEKERVLPSVERGVYEHGFPLTFTASKGSHIRYTLDGTFPTRTHGMIYTDPIEITTTTTVNAIAYSEHSESEVEAFTYILLNNYPNEKRSTKGRWLYKSSITDTQYKEALQALPIVSVTSNTKELQSDGTYIPVTFEYLSSHKDGKSNVFQRSGGRRFGQFSKTELNAGISLKFSRAMSTKKFEYAQLFPEYRNDTYPNVSKFTELELKEGQDGPQVENPQAAGYLRYDDQVTHELTRQMGKFSIATRYVHYFYNGLYMGVKTLREEFDRDTMSAYFGGDEKEYTIVNFQDKNFSTGVVEEGDVLLYDRIQTALRTKNFQEFKKYVDVHDLIQFQIMFMFIDSETEAIGIVHNTPDGVTQPKMKFNINDTDGAFFNTGQIGIGATYFWGGGTYRYKWDHLSVARSGPGGMIRVFGGNGPVGTYPGNLEFKTYVKDEILNVFGYPYVPNGKRKEELPLSKENVSHVILNNIQELEYPYALDTAFMSYSSSAYSIWQNENKKVINQLEDRVNYSLHMWEMYGMTHTLHQVNYVEEGEGKYSLQTEDPDVEIYFTRNGSDPMGENGTISNHAERYTHVIERKTGEQIVVRAFSKGNIGPKSYLP